jgi:hypothetical protein
MRLRRTPASPRRGRCPDLGKLRERPPECRVRSGVAFSVTGITGDFQKTPAKGENDMTTSSARATLLGAAIAASMGIGYAIGAQPHMTASIGLLQSARGELAAATPNKGGHRERAMGLIDQAIGEVRAGIAFAGG